MAWVIVLAVVAVVLALVSNWRRSDHAADMGAVSSQWISEHRLGSSQDSRR